MSNSLQLSTVNDPQLTYVVQTLQKTASSENELTSIATIALKIWDVQSDTPKFKSLCETSCDAAYSGIYYAGRATEIPPATRKKLDELNRILEEILTFCHSVRSNIVFRVLGFRDERKVKEFRSRLRKMITKDFVPEDWKPLSIREQVESAARRARQSEPPPADCNRTE